MRIKSVAGAIVGPLFFGLMLLFGGVPSPLMAQEQPAAADYQSLSPDQIEGLTARVALYPDAILSEIFVAASYPLQVVEAAQWLAAGNNPAAADQQPWDASVKGLTRFPTVLQQMAADAAWTNDLGAAFLYQKADVFASVQRLRAQAIAAGTLYSTPQQQVVQDAGVIQIIPADPATIYLPTYDPNAIYYQQAYTPGAVITAPEAFDYSAPVGPWLAFDCDWDDGAIYIGDWGRDRPWWHWHDPGWHYGDFRPGHFTPPAHTDWHPQEWSHDPHARGPTFRPLPEGRPGHGALPGRPEGFPEIDRGPAAGRDADRGRSEREPAAPAARPEPAREQPRPEPVREAPVFRPAPPEREAPPAIDYRRGDDAARDSQRGSESRGGGGAPARSAPGGGGGGGGGGGHAGGGGRR